MDGVDSDGVAAGAISGVPAAPQPAKATENRAIIAHRRHAFNSVPPYPFNRITYTEIRRRAEDGFPEHAAAGWPAVFGLLSVVAVANEGALMVEKAYAATKSLAADADPVASIPCSTHFKRLNAAWRWSTSVMVPLYTDP